MGRGNATIGDLTPLDTLSIDVPARIGWLLRICRTAEHVSVREMSSRLADLGVSGARSPGAISQLETKGIRNGRLIDGYEAALGYAPGRLRSVVDILCRTFQYSPADLQPGIEVSRPLQEMDDVLAAAEESPTGSDWLQLARRVSIDSATPLPTRVMAPLIERMLDEMVRSVGPAFYLRWEAFARLQDSVYAPTCLAASQRFLAVPGAEPMATMVVSIVSERPSREGLAWLLSLFETPSYEVFRGAAFGVGNLRHVGGLQPDDWTAVVEPFLAAHQRWGDTARGPLLTELFKNLPPDCRSLIEPRLATPLRALRGPSSWEMAHDNEHWVVCKRLAARVAAAHGLPTQPLLARMLFESLYDFRSNVTTSSWLLSVTPLAPALHTELFVLVDKPPDEATRTGALRAIFTSATPASDAVAQRWFAGLSVEQRCANLGVAEQFAISVPAAVHDVLADDPERGPDVVRALGSAGQADGLRRIASDPAAPQDLRAAAAWWIQRGGRVGA